MVVHPQPGDHVYASKFDMVGEVHHRDELWFVVDHGDGLSASKPDDLVVPTAHARMRWSQRIAGRESRADDYDPGRAISEAWGRGTELERHGMEGDEVRLDRDTGAVMVLQGNAVATIISPDDRKPKLTRAVAQA